MKMITFPLFSWTSLTAQLNNMFCYENGRFQFEKKNCFNMSLIAWASYLLTLNVIFLSHFGEYENTVNLSIN